MMGVKVKKEDRIRRVAEQRREKIRRFPEAHKVRHGGKNYSRGVRYRAFKNGNSREVLVRITGSGRTPRVVKNEINYIAREGELTLRDSDGKEYFLKEREERKQSYAFMTDQEDKLVYKDESAPYPYSTHCLDCFADPELAKSVYMQAFPLVDVTAIPDEEIVTHRHVALMELVMKHIRTRDMLELSQEIATLLNQWVLQPELFRGLICYIVERGNTSDAKQFLHQIAEKATDYREVVMTIAEQLRQEGIVQGREEGIQLGEPRGIEKGRHEAKIDMARQFLANGVDRAIVKMSTGLSDAEINALMDGF